MHNLLDSFAAHPFPDPIVWVTPSGKAAEHSFRNPSISRSWRFIWERMTAIYPTRVLQLALNEVISCSAFHVVPVFGVAALCQKRTHQQHTSDATSLAARDSRIAREEETFRVPTDATAVAFDIVKDVLVQ